MRNVRLYRRVQGFALYPDSFVAAFFAFWRADLPGVLKITDLVPLRSVVRLALPSAR